MLGLVFAKAVRGEQPCLSSPAKCTFHAPNPCTHAQGHPRCMAEMAAHHAKIYLAIEKLAEDCGLTGMCQNEMCYWRGVMLGHLMFQIGGA